MENYEHTPPALAAVHAELWQEVLKLHLRLLAFRALFASDEATVDLLDRVANAHFGLLRDLLVEALILGICRLTDHPGSGQRTNITLFRLMEHIDKATHPELAASVGELLAKAEAQSKPARAYRDKRIAHVDLGVHRGQVELDRLMYGDLEAVIETVRQIMDTVEAYFEQGSKTAYEGIMETGDTKALIWALARGEESLARERQVRGW